MKTALQTAADWRQPLGRGGAPIMHRVSVAELLEFEQLPSHLKDIARRLFREHDESIEEAYERGRHDVMNEIEHARFALKKTINAIFFA